MLPPVTFNHLGFHVFDLDRMEDFYTRVMGFAVSDRGEVRGFKAVFLTRDPADHHQIVLFSGRTAPREAVFLNQLTFQVDTLEILLLCHAALEAEGITQIRCVDHGVSWSLYYPDPEGNRIELFAKSPWYIVQPHIAEFDPAQPAAAIFEGTRSRIAADPTLVPMAQWEGAFAARLNNAPRRRKPSSTENET
jgi:catechol 2,3-dioxygenase